jgi:hypothetical protein
MLTKEAIQEEAGRQLLRWLPVLCGFALIALFVGYRVSGPVRLTVCHAQRGIAAAFQVRL